MAILAQYLPVACSVFSVDDDEGVLNSLVSKAVELHKYDKNGFTSLLSTWMWDGEYFMHWRSFHYTVTQVCNKNSDIQGRSANVVKVIFHTIRNCS